MNGRHRLQLGWSGSAGVLHRASTGEVGVTFDVGRGDVHAVPGHEDYALCGARIVWPERHARPSAAELPDHACPSCRDVYPVFRLLTGPPR